MRKLVYYVAMSLDGFISGPNESIDGYVDKGSGIDQYFADLADLRYSDHGSENL